jgi:dihydropteroate synthase
MKDCPMTPHTPACPRADRGIRILSAATPADVQCEIARVGCRDAGVRIMTPRGLLRLVRLEGVATKVANILKQEMLAHGGDAAVHWQTIACGVAQTAVLLLGTEAQLYEVCAHLRRQPFGLAATGEAILAALAAYSAPGSALRCGPYTLPLGRKTYVMGIINVTPDSFSGDGLATHPDTVLRQGEAMVAAGADLLDVGGESTRPGAVEVPLEEELRRVVSAVRALAPLRVPISVDTYKSAVAREAVAAGATLLNDISGLRFDADMARVAAEAELPVVVMHIQGTPRTMQQQPHYEDLMTEVCAYLQQSTELAVAAGVPRDQVILDPGFGFGKSVADNLTLIRRLRELTSYGQPVLLGTSRKSTIGKVLGDLPPQERIEGTAATVALGIANGAAIIRVHDVLAMARVARMTDAIVRDV